MSELSRRGLLRGLGFIAFAPAIVRVSSLMPVRAWYRERVLTTRLIGLMVQDHGDGLRSVMEQMRVGEDFSSIQIAYSGLLTPKEYEQKVGQVLDKWRFQIPAVGNFGCIRWIPPFDCEPLNTQKFRELV